MCNNIMYSKMNLLLREKTQNIYIAVGVLPNNAVTMLRYIFSALPCLEDALSCFFLKLKPEEPGWSHLLPGEASPTFIAKFWHDGKKALLGYHQNSLNCVQLNSAQLAAFTNCSYCQDFTHFWD